MKPWLYGASVMLLLSSAAFAQPQPNGQDADHNSGVVHTPGTPPDSGMAGKSPGQRAGGGRTDESNSAVGTSSQGAVRPARGANSFTSTEAQKRIERHGYSDVQSLQKDADGVWRGQARKGGQQVAVWLDFRGNIGQSQ